MARQTISDWLDATSAGVGNGCVDRRLASSFAAGKKFEQMLGATMELTDQGQESVPALNEDLARTVLHQGELRLQAHLALALAADQRALTLTAMFAATAVAAFGFGASWIDGQAANVPLGVGAIVAGLAFVGAAALCARVARPLSFALVGAAGEMVGRWRRNPSARRVSAQGIEKLPEADRAQSTRPGPQRRVAQARSPSRLRGADFRPCGLGCGCGVGLGAGGG